ncbi:MAG TPA: hypothetical protein VHY37_09490 [Tepidisphaeraceae bacterium]|nr:hypothetical protein [Tepidisphaeraceae bacterium]
MKVFLDANVLFAASNPASSTAQLVDLLVNGSTAVTCDFALAEATRNVQIKWSARAGNLAKLMENIEVVAAVQFALPVKLAAEEVPILCSALRSRCSHLATGDRRDFGHLYDHSVEGVTIIALLRLAELLQNQ